MYRRWNRWRRIKGGVMVCLFGVHILGPALAQQGVPGVQRAGQGSGPPRGGSGPPGEVLGRPPSEPDRGPDGAPVQRDGGPGEAPGGPVRVDGPGRDRPSARSEDSVGGVDQDGNSLLPRLTFKNSPTDLILEDYAEVTGLTLLISPGVPKANVTLRSQTDLTVEEYLQAIETVLMMHGITLLEVEGGKFLKVVATKEARQESMPIETHKEGSVLPENDKLVSQMIALKHIDLTEAKQAVETIKHSYAQIHVFERINSLLVTDTAANINRLVQIIKYIDQPVEAREEPNIVVVQYAKAADIKKKLEEIIAESQKEAEKVKSTVPQQKSSGSPGVVTARTPPGVVRAPRPTAEPSQPVSMAEIIEQAERGIIRGKVKIVADERTNILIIITRPENMSFFEKIIRVLDVATDPDVVVKVILLEYADSETVASTLNTLIGQADKDKATPVGQGGDDEGKSAALREFVEQRQRDRPAETGKSKVGELSSSNIKILPDKRTNSLLIMASKGDFEAIKEIIEQMDIMLSQVLIETVIIQVDLDDTLTSGLQWVQRAIVAYTANADGTRDAIGAYAGSAGAGNLVSSPANTATLTSLDEWASNTGLTAFFTHFGLSFDVVMRLVATDSRTQVLSSPVIVTTDNTKATVTSSEQRYFLTGTSVDQFGNVEPETEIRDIGLDLEVTPHINRSRNVMMEIAQTISDLGVEQQIADNSWPTTKKRSMTASIAVRDRETIILGGLVRTGTSQARSKVPLLGSIPLLGRLFSYQDQGKSKGEIVVFVTPYVLDTPEDIAEESRRRKESLNMEGLWRRGWSNSRLAESTGKEKSAEKHLDRERRRQDKAEKKRLAAEAEVAARVPVSESLPPPAAPSPASPSVSEEESDPVSRLDPELQDFIQRQEKRWDKALKRVDGQTDREAR